MELVINSKGCQPGVVVGEDVVHEKGQLGAEDLTGLRIKVLPNHLALRILDAQDDHRLQLAEAGVATLFGDGLASHDTAVGEDGEGIGHVQQPHLTAAQGKAQAIVVGIKGVDAHAMCGVDHILYPHFAEHPHGGHVVGSGQRQSQALRAVVFAAVVFRHIIGVGIIIEAGAHIQDHGGRGVALGQGGHVGEGFES